jgi:hypothetical protein
MWPESLAARAAIVLGALLVTALGSAYLGYNYAMGKQARAYVSDEAKAQSNTDALAKANDAAAAPVVAKIEAEKVRTQVIVKEVPVVQVIHEPAPVTECPAAITGRDRVLIDAAAAGTDPPAADGVNDPAYPAGPLTGSVVSNYGACRVCAERLRGLQDYVARSLANQELLCPQR